MRLRLIDLIWLCVLKKRNKGIRRREIKVFDHFFKGKTKLKRCQARDIPLNIVSLFLSYQIISIVFSNRANPTIATFTNSDFGEVRSVFRRKYPTLLLYVHTYLRKSCLQEQLIYYRLNYCWD
jgi:hypothetical protein